MLLELVEPLGPDLAVALDPVDRAVEGLGLEPARPVLGVAAPGDEPGALEHLQVLRDRLAG